MPGTEFRVDLESLSALNGRIETLTAFDAVALLEGVGAILESGARQRIQETKQAPDGTDWTDLRRDYAASDHAPGSDQGSLLYRTGALNDSLFFELDGDGAVRVGSPLVYAAIQQFGPENGSEDFGIIPRPYLGVSDEEEDGILDLVSRLTGSER